MRVRVCRSCMLLVFAAVLLGMFGCAPSQHQIIGTNESCVTCHADGKTTYEVGTPFDVVQTGSTVMVNTQADSLVVCTPTFTSEDGSHYVPVQVTVVKVEGQEKSIELEDGLWALCVDEGDTARTKLVSVNSSRTESAVVEL